MTNLDIFSNTYQGMNTQQYPNHQPNSIPKVLSIMFVISTLLMAASFFIEGNPFEQKSVFDKPLKVNGGSTQQESMELISLQSANDFSE